MRALLLTTITVLLGISFLSGQVTLRNSLSGKAKTLKAGGQVGLGLPFEGPDLDCGYRMLNGTLENTTRGVVRLMPVDEVKTLDFNTGLAKREELRYEGIKALRPMSFSIADIDHLTYRKKGTEGRSDWGALITTVGALGALVAAPLVSIGYGGGEFNSDRYFRWAGYSLGAAGLGVALIVSGKKRHFDIQRPGQAASKKLWVIEE